ncbi:MAG: hypothetical protein ACHQNA_10600 [Acidimicrobiales bacterium]
MADHPSTSDQVDARYHAMYRIGGIALVLTGLAYAICFLLTLMIPASSGGAAAYLQATAGAEARVATLWVVYLLSDLLLIPAALALYFVLRARSRALVPIGMGLVAAYIVFDLGVTEPNWLALLSLAHSYSGAASVDQPLYVAAAQYGLALVPFLNFLSFAVSGAGWFLVSVVMLRGIFGRRTAYFGIATMVMAFLAALSWFLPSLGLAIIVCLAMFAVWCVLVGEQLYHLGITIAKSGDAPVGRQSSLTAPAGAGVN